MRFLGLRSLPDDRGSRLIKAVQPMFPYSRGTESRAHKWESIYLSRIAIPSDWNVGSDERNVNHLSDNWLKSAIVALPTEDEAVQQLALCVHGLTVGI